MEINLIIAIIVPAAALGAGFFFGWLISSKFSKNKISSAIEKAAKIIDDAEKDSKHLKKEKLLEVKDEWLKKKQEFDNEVNQKSRNSSPLKNSSDRKSVV